MFVLSLTYVVPLEQIDALRADHLAWLAEGREAGHFIAWGRKVPVTGGLIFALAESKAEAEVLAAGDPFIKAGGATVEVIEFSATYAGPGLEALGE